jgi:uncharacterized membrane protein
VKIASVGCLVLGLLLLVVAFAQPKPEAVGTTLTDEQFATQSEARKVMHQSTVPGETVDTAAVEKAKADQDKIDKEAERQANTRRLVKLVLQIVSGIFIVSGIVLVAIDKMRE